MSFDWDAVRRTIAIDPDVPWAMGKSKETPRGIKVVYLNDEARLWQQILSKYVMPSTHESEVPAAMILLIWCVMEEKDLYLPRLIRKYMSRVHVRGTLAFPYLVTQMAGRVEVPWEPEDERPPIANCKKVIPHGKRFDPLDYRPPTTAPTEAATSLAALAAPPTSALSSTSQPVYHLVHCHFERLDQMEHRNQRRYEQFERRNKRRYAHLRLIVTSGRTDIPSEPDTPSKHYEEEDEQEEDEPEETQ
ncbi:uncharacterized protein LOC130950678 [Arachis stenosperma]|uniref:uncharacterized protein LOC130950678 n=1 Tax=Arachis stenosperma TaxID=217475 RepID=UPI0025AC8C33|nr:uncharacterized protein LOC130950678 [Arachis stenosperma]XP_057735221.1 uncharacterized protein LOC130950678 [Arachis stenosperma]